MTNGDPQPRALPATRDPSVGVALARTVAETIRPIAGVVAVLYLLLDIRYVTMSEVTAQPHWRPLLASDVFTVVLFAAIAVFGSPERRLLRRHPHAVALTLIADLYVNVGLLVLLKGDARDLTHLNLLAIGMTPLTLRGRTWVFNAGAALGLVAAYSVTHPNVDSTVSATAVVAGVVVSFGWMYTQRASVRRLVAANAATRQAAEEMSAALEQLSAITESAQDAIITADDTGHITSWNAGAERMLGYARANALGRSVADLLPETGHGALHDTYAAVAAGAPLQHRLVEIDARHRDGETVPVEASVGSWYSHDGRRFFSAVLRDLTDRRLAEKARRDTEERAARQRNALHLHDSVAQGLATALYALELGQHQQAEDAVRTTLTAARRIITDALGTSDIVTILTTPHHPGPDGSDDRA